MTKEEGARQREIKAEILRIEEEMVRNILKNNRSRAIALGNTAIRLKVYLANPTDR